MRRRYYTIGDPLFSGSLQRLHSAYGNCISRKSIGTFLRGETTQQYFKQPRWNFPRNAYYAPYKRYLMQCDLIDMQSLSRYNKSYKYILALIDCHTRKAFLAPLKSKSPSDVSPALDKLLEKSGAPRRVQSDRGIEFFGAETRAMFQRKNIHHYSGTTSDKAHIVERFIRSIKGILYKFLEQNQTRNWVDNLDGILRTYNTHKH